MTTSQRAVVFVGVLAVLGAVGYSLLPFTARVSIAGEFVSTHCDGALLGAGSSGIPEASAAATRALAELRKSGDLEEAMDRFCDEEGSRRIRRAAVVGLISSVMVAVGYFLLGSDNEPDDYSEL